MQIYVCAYIRTHALKKLLILFIGYVENENRVQRYQLVMRFFFFSLSCFLSSVEINEDQPNKNRQKLFVQSLLYHGSQPPSLAFWLRC